MRERLPDVRPSVTHKLVLRLKRPNSTITRLHIYITVGLYDDKRPAELFLCLDNADETLVGFSKMWAIAVSLCLQSGVTLEKLVEKFAHQQFSPQGFTEDDKIRSCKSIVDYVIRWMDAEFKKRVK